jgi:hypothetical protein
VEDGAIGSSDNIGDLGALDAEQSGDCRDL